MAYPLVDSHTHLDATEFDEDRDAVVERALQAGVTRIITIGASGGAASACASIKLAEKYPSVWATVGIHPQDAKTPFDIELIKDLARHPRVVGIGETGLDYFRDWASPEEQRRWFRAQIELALEVGKPIVIHSRQAGEECLTTLEQNGASKVGGVFHCYAEDAAFAKRLANMNFLVSFPGPVTFKKADALRATVKEIPLSQIMVETDAPFMAPEPFRGKRCESAYVVETARMIAKIKDLPLDEVARITTENAVRLFRLPENKQ